MTTFNIYSLQYVILGDPVKVQLCTPSYDPPKQLCNLFRDLITFEYPELPALSVRDNDLEGS